MGPLTSAERRRRPADLISVASCWARADSLAGLSAGVPLDRDQCGWSVGLSPVDYRPDNEAPARPGATFSQAGEAFDAAWRDYLPGCTEADSETNRRQRVATDWKYRMHGIGT